MLAMHSKEFNIRILMLIVRDKISLEELKKMSDKMFGRLVKTVVDIEKKIMVVDAELHADEETLLLEQEDSKQEHLWGINIHPAREDEGFVEFDSMINLRPSFGNRTLGVDDPELRKTIRNIVNQLITK